MLPPYDAESFVHSEWEDGERRVQGQSASPLPSLSKFPSFLFESAVGCLSGPNGDRRDPFLRRVGAKPVEKRFQLVLKIGEPRTAFSLDLFAQAPGLEKRFSALGIIFVIPF